MTADSILCNMTTTAPGDPTQNRPIDKGSSSTYQRAGTLTLKPRPCALTTGGGRDLDREQPPGHMANPTPKPTPQLSVQSAPRCLSMFLFKPAYQGISQGEYRYGFATWIKASRNQMQEPVLVLEARQPLSKPSALIGVPTCCILKCATAMHMGVDIYQQNCRAIMMFRGSCNYSGLQTSSN